MQTAQPSTVTAAADVWTVGALMFEAATGERVQQSGLQARASAKGLYERAQAADGNGMLGALHEMVLDCLAVAPAARPTIRSIVPVRPLPSLPSPGALSRCCDVVHTCA